LATGAHRDRAQTRRPDAGEAPTKNGDRDAVLFQVVTGGAEEKRNRRQRD